MYGTAKVCNGNIGHSMQGPEYARAKECRDKSMQGPMYVGAKVCEGLIIQGPKYSRAKVVKYANRNASV